MASREESDKTFKELIEAINSLSPEEMEKFMGALGVNEPIGETISLDEALEKLADELGKDCPNDQCICKKEKND